MRKTLARGFTLIELVVVIVILGILSAFAVPHFLGLENQARIASVSALRGSISSAATMAYGISLATGTNNLAAGTIPYNGGTLAVKYGYPTTTTIQNMVQDTTTFTPVGNNPLSYQKIGATTPASCSVIYNPPTAAGGVPTILYGPAPGSTTPPVAGVC